MGRRLFCELGPAAYAIASLKERVRRRMQDFFARPVFARAKGEPLPVKIYAHNSLIRRKLGNVDMRLQENKANNLALTAPKVDGILIRPGETFSFWALAGNPSARKGYREGLTISSGAASSGVGGGMCQFTNLLHWMALHSPLTVAERHHHNGLDLFPDFGRQVPFGCGTSIVYNYLDYRLKNETGIIFQFLVHTDGEYLRGELRADREPEYAYHIAEEDACFVKAGDDYYRRNRVVRRVIDRQSGDLVRQELLDEADAKVMYDHALIDREKIKV